MGLHLLFELQQSFELQKESRTDQGITIETVKQPEKDL